MAMIRTYTETYDMNTEKDCPTLLSIHTPIGTTPYRFLEPAFKMYQKYKYLGADVTIVNAARLPVDPEQLGKISGTNYIDPRDTLNPILFKGCHGESLGRILDSMYDGAISSAGFTESSVDKDTLSQTLQNFYYTALGDDSWRKSPIQKTLRISGLHPLVYSLSTQHQILPTNALGQANYMENINEVLTPQQVSDLDNGPGNENGRIAADSTGWDSPQVAPTLTYNPAIGGYEYRQGMTSMFTSRMHRLGWLDTMQYVGQNSNDTQGTLIGQQLRTVALLPKIFMGILMLPPANLCRQYLRVIIRHRFMFAKFRTVTTGGVSMESFDPLNYSIGYKNNYTGNVPDGTKAAIVDDPQLDNEVIESDD